MIPMHHLVFGRKYAIPNLVSAYKMQNNVLDSLGVNNGTAYNITYDTGIAGQSAVLNGSSSYIGITRTPSLEFASTGFTIMFSVYLIGTNQPVTFISVRNTNTKAEFQFAYEKTGGITDNLFFHVFSGGGVTNYISVSDLYTIPLNTWINYAITYNLGTDIKIYRNGVQVSIGVSTTGTFVSMINTNSRLVLGKHGYSGLALLNARMDEVYVFNKALTSTEIATYNATINSGNSLL